tara:strand:- start:232 stop:429 length:198 start_codon:yes stop_codon:yes gene_type:complete
MKAKRTLEERKILADKIVKYYFENPRANSYKNIVNEFKVDEAFIRKTLDQEFERRFNNAKRMRTL